MSTRALIHFDKARQELALPESVEINAIADIEYLPHCYFSERRRLPDMSGLYFVLDEGSVLYIGKSYSIRRRWVNHHRTPWIERYAKQAKIYWVLIADISQLDALEKKLIRVFEPKYNNYRVSLDTVEGKPSECFLAIMDRFLKSIIEHEQISIEELLS